MRARPAATISAMPEGLAIPIPAIATNSRSEEGRRSSRSPGIAIQFPGAWHPRDREPAGAVARPPHSRGRDREGDLAPSETGFAPESSGYFQTRCAATLLRTDL